MATLADINNTLMASNQIARQSDAKIDALAQMWADYTSDYRKRYQEEELKQLEAEREANRAQQTQSAAQVTKATDDGGARLFGGLFDNPIGLAKSIIKGLFTKGVLGAALIFLADEITEAIGMVEDSTISDLVQGMIIGGGAGLIVGGLKGGLVGVIAGAGLVLSKTFGDAVEKAARDYNFENSTAILLGDVAQSLGNIATGAAAGAIVGGPIGAIIGAVAASLFEISTYIIRYNTDEEYKKIVDEAFGKMGAAISNVMDSIIASIQSVIEFGKETLNAGLEKIGLGDLIITEAERARAEAAMLQTDSGQAQLQKDAAARKQLEQVAATRAQLLGARTLEDKQAIASGLGIDTEGLSSGQLVRQINSVLNATTKSNEAVVDATNDMINATLSNLPSEEEAAAAASAAAVEAVRSSLSTQQNQLLDQTENRIAILEQQLANVQGNRYSGYSGTVSVARANRISQLEEQIAQQKGIRQNIVNAPTQTTVQNSNPVIFSGNRPSSAHRRFTSD